MYKVPTVAEIDHKAANLLSKQRIYLIMNELYLLEYSEEQRCFNFNNGNSEENSHGYKSLGKHTWEECTAFIEYMKNKYNDSDYPLLDEVKKDYSSFTNQ